MKTITKSDLAHSLRMSKSNDIGTIADAYREISKAGKDRYMASGVTITIKNINKEKNIIVEEVMISDGLSSDTIEAIQRDLKASYDLRLTFAKI